ncbi:MAG: aminotransferase class V-fold PLP-dependent enzyme [Phycisphaeraceae bacterium]|nr:aminotransferase class V-fold PLP-dependent enzyme [Phycisphaeraceae bacterium]
MIYLDNAATSWPKAPGVAQAMSKFLAEDAANPGRSGHRMAVRAEAMLDDVRLRLARLIDAEDHHRIVFTLNATDALNMAIKGVLGGMLGSSPRPHVITTVLEHNSVSRPLQSLADHGAIDLTRVDCDDQGFVNPWEIQRQIRPATRLIVMTHASNVLGTIQDIGDVGRIARERDVLLLVDAAQSAGAVPISIRQMHIDLLALPGHKSLLGPTGTGALYVGPRCPDPLSPQSEASHRSFLPWREGGTGGDSSSPTQPAIYPYFLEGGTPNTVGIAGLGAALDYLAKQDSHASLQHEQQLVQRIIDNLSRDERFTVLGPRHADRRVGAVALTLRDMEPSDLGAILDDSFHIAVRPGLHCSPYIHKRMGTYPAGAVRVSPGPFSTEADVDAFLDAVTQIAG